VRNVGYRFVPVKNSRDGDRLLSEAEEADRADELDATVEQRAGR
jgi:hypothetical protein